MLRDCPIYFITFYGKYNSGVAKIGSSNAEIRALRPYCPFSGSTPINRMSDTLQLVCETKISDNREKSDRLTHTTGAHAEPEIQSTSDCVSPSSGAATATEMPSSLI